jgi:crotonobetainyl-CoA:carnitine CoA-transferase CaiB-like acyl-CoA transferase
VLTTARLRIHECTWQEWEKAFEAEPDIAVEPYRTAEEATRHPQMLHNGDVVDVADPTVGPMRQIGPLVTLHGTPATIGRPAPAPGEHDSTAFFPRYNGSTPAAIPGGPPLAGVTVVELAWFYAAPFGLALLADLGARVIKVENLTGDPHRSQTGVKEFAGVKGLQGKESLAVDTGSPEGMEILHRLLRRADLVMRNFRQEAAVRMGIDASALLSVNPDLFYLYAAAYGSSGPSARRPAYAPTIGAGAGHQAWHLGRAHAFEDVEPLRADEAVRLGGDTFDRQSHILVNADAGAALGVGTAMLLGLLARQRTGTGQSAQTTMLCTNAYLTSEDYLTFEGKPPHVLPDSDANGLGALYRLYPARSGWVFLAVTDDDEWSALCAGIAEGSDGVTDLAGDERFLTAEERAGHDGELADALTVAFARREASSWESLLTARDLACVEVNEQPFSRFTIEHPAMVENGFVGETVHPWFGRHRRHGPLVSMSESPASLGAGCLIGQHTRQILDELGYSAEEVDDLRARGVVTWPADD